MPPQLPANATALGVTITNPLTLYRTLLLTKRIDPDPAQHRLAIELQKLYFRLKDYSPQAEYGAQLKALKQAVGSPKPADAEKQVAVPGHPLRQNPFFAHLFQKKEHRDMLALTRVLTIHEAAKSIASPRGLLLHGEVGTGKSLLVDLLADCLPNPKKRRWHFNTFMLETLARLEQLRQSRSVSGLNLGDPEHSLLWLAKDMVDNSPILFLDEFQLPDRAASKILSNLFTTFFQLGGVLIATSNRMPDELSKASGMGFPALLRGGLQNNSLGFGEGRSRRLGMFPSNNEYAGFVEVLKARCEVWNMGGRRDWRRREAEEMDAEASEIAEIMRQEMLEGSWSLAITETEIIPKIQKGTTPKKFFLAGPEDEKAWQSAIQSKLPSTSLKPIPWESTMLSVFGRQVNVPQQFGGVTYWTFSELCGGNFGPADYITLASTFHTWILDEVPILTLLQKNEARRLITLLDSLYEARCKLLIRAEAGPDELFFPEIKQITTIGPGEHRPENDGGDAVYPETLSEIYQDQTSPFRPNISSYTEEPKSGYDPDEDSDFGPIPGKGNEIGRQVGFGMSSFTGEDEKFAYERARSRLWEMCGNRWHERSEPGWWRPLPLEVRRWERSSNPVASKEVLGSGKSDVQMGEWFDLDKPAGLQGKEIEEENAQSIPGPFREPRELPPRIGWTHAWGMIKWGKKAGAWGQGPEGLDQTDRRRGRSE